MILIEGKIKSIELIDQINFFRVEEGKSKKEHYDLMKVIRDEFEEEISQGEISLSTYHNGRRDEKCYDLTPNQAKQLLARESKYVRKALIKYIDNLEQKASVPMTIEDMIISQAQSMKALRNEMVEFKDEVNDKFDKVVTLESGKQRKLQRSIACRVYDRLKVVEKEQSIVLGQVYDEECEKSLKIRKKLFSNIHRELKNKFGVSSYKDIRVVEFDIALNWIENWIEDDSVRSDV